MRAGCAETTASVGERLPLGAFDPRCRVACAAAAALSVAFADTFPALLFACPIPMILAAIGDKKTLLRALARVNPAGLIVCLILPLTYPGRDVLGFLSAEGLKLAILILCRLNLVTIAFFRLVVPLSAGEIDCALRRFGVSEKFRVLLLLTARQIFVLADRIAIAARAVALRSARAPLRMRLRVHANMLGTTLIHASDRAERAAMAMRARGGLSGFRQSQAMTWRLVDTLFLAACVASAAAVVAARAGWRL
jgi:energy-coupling factor transporter transmembrane protein EcfT